MAGWGNDQFKFDMPLDDNIEMPWIDEVDDLSGLMSMLPQEEPEEKIEEDISPALDVG